MKYFLANCRTVAYFVRQMKPVRRKKAKKTLALPESVVKAIQTEANKQRRSFSWMTTEMLTQALQLELADSSKVK